MHSIRNIHGIQKNIQCTKNAQIIPKTALFSLPRNVHLSLKKNGPQTVANIQKLRSKNWTKVGGHTPYRARPSSCASSALSPVLTALFSNMRHTLSNQLAHINARTCLKPCFIILQGSFFFTIIIVASIFLSVPDTPSFFRKRKNSFALQLTVGALNTADV